jgi:hypothetical protein
VHAGQVAVEHHHVVPGDQRQFVPDRTVVGDVDGHALAPQAARDRVGEVVLVFDHEYPHRTVSSHAAQPWPPGVKSA